MIEIYYSREFYKEAILLHMGNRVFRWSDKDGQWNDSTSGLKLDLSNYVKIIELRNKDS